MQQYHRVSRLVRGKVTKTGVRVIGVYPLATCDTAVQSVVAASIRHTSVLKQVRLLLLTGHCCRAKVLIVTRGFAQKDFYKNASPKNLRKVGIAVFFGQKA